MEDPNPENGLLCEHVKGITSPYVCVQAVGKGDLKVLFHLQFGSDAEGLSNIEDKRRYIRAQKQLATAVSKHLALAISNLAQREKLQQAAEHDGLTGLFNQAYMETILPREVIRSARNRSLLGVIMADIDHFKLVNDTFGHQAGDKVLRAVGKLLKTHIRETDIPCRCGGEEFMLIMPETLKDAVLARAKDIQRDVKKLDLEHEGKSLSVTMSFGVAFLPSDNEIGQNLRAAQEEAIRLTKEKVEGLKRAADSALYRAKDEGRDRIVVWDGQDVEHVPH